MDFVAVIGFEQFNGLVVSFGLLQLIGLRG